MASASPAVVPPPTFDQPPQCPAPPVLKQSPAFAVPTPKMTSSAPTSMATSPCSVPVSLPAPLPQPPFVPWLTRCIQQPVPLAQLEDFLAQDVEQNSPPEEQSTLAHALAREMDPIQQADHIHDQTWHKQKVEKKEDDGTAKMEDGNGTPAAFACQPTSLSTSANNIDRNDSCDHYPGEPGSSIGSSSQAA